MFLDFLCAILKLVGWNEHQIPSRWTIYMVSRRTLWNWVKSIQPTNLHFKYKQLDENGILLLYKFHHGRHVSNASYRHQISCHSKLIQLSQVQVSWYCLYIWMKLLKIVFIYKWNFKIIVYKLFLSVIK